MKLFPPCVAALTGPSLHYKSFAAERIRDDSNFAIRDCDEVRKQLYPQFSGVLLPPEQGLPLMDRVYRAMMKDVEMLTEFGTPVVISSAFARAVLKDMLIRWAHEHPQIPVRVFRLEVTSREVIRERLKERERRGTLSDIKTEADYDWLRSIEAPWPTDFPVTLVNAEQPIEAVVGEILGHLRGLEL
ncbi:MAG: hypothetical protein AAB480_02335 [Patescibacteria group bacterium]